MTDFNTEIELRLPSSIREIWNKLVVRGIYLSADNERDLYNDILRYEDNIREFFEIFDQTLVVHRRDFVYAEDRKTKRLIKNAEQLMVFLSVFFEKFRKLYPSPLTPWYEELSVKVVSLGAMNLYSTESFERRLLSVGLHDELDIFEKVLRPASVSFLLHIHSSDLYSVNSPEDAAAVEFKFNAPVYRFIDIFADIAGGDMKILPEADDKSFSAEEHQEDISFEEPDNDGGSE
jgi:hypothetical protein